MGAGNIDGIPLGSFWGTKGPDRYAFLLEGLLIRLEAFGVQEFEIEGAKVRIKICGALQVPHWECPEMPPSLVVHGAAYDWRDAWEFTGYVPGYAIGVRAVYSASLRKGRFDLWEQATLDYTCVTAQEDIATFFTCARDDGYPEAALRRAMKHMTTGTGVIGYLKVRCESCWGAYTGFKNSLRTSALFVH